MYFHALTGCTIAAGLLYSYLFDKTFLVCWLVVFIPYVILTQCVYKNRANASLKNSIRAASWSGSTDPVIFDLSEIPVDKTLAFIEKKNKEIAEKNAKDNGVRPLVTQQHVFAWAVGQAFYKNRGNIGRLPFGWLKPATNFGMTLQSTDKEKSIPATVWDAHLKTVEEIAHESDKNWKAGRAFFERTKKGPLALLPPSVLQIALHLFGYLS